MLTQGVGGGPSSYRIGTFSGMLMMWSSAWSPGFCCRGMQLLREERLSALIFKKCFSDASSRPSVQLLEPGLVPAKPPRFHLSLLHYFLGFLFFFAGDWTWKTWIQKQNSFRRWITTLLKVQKKSELLYSCQNKHFHQLSWLCLDLRTASHRLPLTWPAVMD